MEQNNDYSFAGVAGSSGPGPSQVRQFLSEIAYDVLIFTC